MGLSEIGEFGLIEKIKTAFSESCFQKSGIRGIGDDCAIISSGDIDWLISTDMLLEGTHFLRDRITPYDLGWKSLAVNLSDIAAMGGHPTGTFLSFGLPVDISPEWVDEFTRGYRDLSRKWSVPLLGGDTTRSAGPREMICINVGVLGNCPSGQCKMRDAALPGDNIFVTGTLGDSSAGLDLILRGDVGKYAPLVTKHLHPEPRIEEGLILRQTEGVHAMMDISDGIASDLKHILTASGVSAEIQLDLLPISTELEAWGKEYGENALEKALAGGEDYELLFTAKEGVTIPIKLKATKIGRIIPVMGNTIGYYRNGKKENISFSGYNHFKK